MEMIARCGVRLWLVQINKETIEQLFRQHYLRMYQLVRVLLKDDAASKDVVSEVSAFYQKGAWRFSLYGMWMFAPAKYESQSFDNQIMNQTEQHIIKDNRRMLMLGVSYNIFSGKKKNIRKNINNYDSDAGAFK